MTPNILFICGSLNQTTQMHQIANQMGEYKCFFTPYYADSIEDFAARHHWLNTSILGGRHMNDTRAYLPDNKLPVDYRGERHPYDLVLTCSDLILPRNLRRKRLVLVQEGITVPEGHVYHLVRTLRFLPRYLADTAASGLSDGYDFFVLLLKAIGNSSYGRGCAPTRLPWPVFPTSTT